MRNHTRSTAAEGLGFRPLWIWVATIGVLVVVALVFVVATAKFEEPPVLPGVIESPDPELTLVRDAADLPRVRELLRMQNHDRDSIKELMDLVVAREEVFEAAATEYRRRGAKDDLLRALTLLWIVSRANRDDRYSEKWWKWQLSRFEVYYRYGVKFEDRQASDKLRAKYESLVNLGVLREKTPYFREMTDIYEKVK